MHTNDQTLDLIHRCLETTPSAGSASGGAARHDRRDDAWFELFELHRWRVERGIRRVLGQAGGPPDSDLVSDLAQDAFCRLIERDGRRLREFQGRTEAELGAFLARLAERTTIDALRRAGAAKRGANATHYSAGTGNEEVSIDEAYDEDTADTLNPEQRLLGAERFRQLVGEIREVCEGPTGERNLRIVRLAVLEGWSSKEIAARLGNLAPSTVDSTLSRIRRRLASRRTRDPKTLRGVTKRLRSEARRPRRSFRRPHGPRLAYLA